MTEKQLRLIEKYKDTILGKPCYKSSYRWKANEFIESSQLLSFLYEMDSSESVLTLEGLEFLREYYGLENIAEMMIADFINTGTSLKYQTKEEIIAWLERLGY